MTPEERDEAERRSRAERRGLMMDFKELVDAVEAAQRHEESMREELRRAQSALLKAECATVNARNALGKAFHDAGLFKGNCDWQLGIRQAPTSGTVK